MANNLDIETLSIKINSDATSASAGIDSLIGDLQRLQSVSSAGVGNLNKIASSIRNIGSAANTLNGTHFSSFAKGIATLSGSLSGLSGIDTNVSRTINSLGRLGKVNTTLNGMNFTKFTDSMKRLSTAMKPLETIGKSNLGSSLNQLRKLPETIERLDKANLGKFATQMKKVASAISPLASKTQKISSVFSRLPLLVKSASTQFQKYNNVTSKSSKTSTGFISKLYNIENKFRTVGFAISAVTGVIGNLWNESSKYIENLNLFNVAMGDATESAKAYAEEVSKAMGIDPSEWMRYQGSFNMMATGFGVSSDKAAIMSQNLTQLAYDYSSLMNVDVETAFDKLNSAMSGQIKGLKEYGNNVSVAAVKQTGLKYGLQGSVSSWDMNTQAIMRYITIMNNASKVDVFNDMARTIATPANAVRILTQQFTMLKRAIGNIASVFISKLIPYVQVFVQLLTKAASWLANFFGFQLPTIDYSGIAGGGADVEDETEDIADNTGTAADNLGTAADNAKELKKQLMGFDELNIINAPDKDTSNAGGSGGGGTGGGTGGGDIGDIDLPTYDFLKGLENNADKLLNKIVAQLKEIFKPLQESWETYGKAVLDSFEYKFLAIDGAVNAVKKSFGEVWQNGTGKKTLDDIFQIVININLMIGNFALRFQEAWESAGTGTKIIQNLWDSVNNVLDCIADITDQLRIFAYEIDFKPLLKSVANITSSFKDFTKVIGDYLSDGFRNVLIPLGKWTIEKALPSLINSLSKALSAVNSVLKILKPYINVIEKVSTALLKLVGNVILRGIDTLATGLKAICSNKALVVGLTGAITGLIVAMNFQRVVTGIGAVGTAVGGLSTLISTVKQFGFGMVLASWGENGSGAASKIAHLWSTINTLNSATGILSGVSAAMGALSAWFATAAGSAGVLSGACGVLSSALAFLEANPLVAVVAAIGIAVAAIAVLSDAFEDTSSEDRYNAKINQVVETNKELEESNKKASDSYKQMKDTLNSSLGDVNSDYILQTTYLDKLIKMTGGKDGYVGNIQEAKKYVDEVNKVCADSVSINKEGLVTWQKTPAAIREEIKALKEKATVEAYEEQYKQAKKEELELRNKLSTAINNQKTAQDNLNKANDELARTNPNNIGMMEDAKKKVEECEGALTDANEELVKVQKNVNNNTAAQGSLDKAIVATTGTIDEQAQANADLAIQNKGTQASVKNFAAGFDYLRNKVATTTGDEQKMYEESKNKLIDTLTQKAVAQGWMYDDIEKKLKAHGVEVNAEETKQINKSLTAAYKQKGDLEKVQQAENDELLALFKQFGIDKNSQDAKQYLKDLKAAQQAGGDQGRGVIERFRSEYGKQDYTDITKRLHTTAQSFLNGSPLKVKNNVAGFNASTPFNAAQSWLNRNPLGVTGKINMTAPKGLSSLFSGALASLGRAISFYAKGGLPDTGEMFIAREAGAEMVGRIGSKNAVANNDQIVNGIASGVYNAVTSAMSNGTGGDVKIAVYPQLNGQTIGESFIEYHNGVVKQTGNSPLNT